jgi:hypothetical protein
MTGAHEKNVHRLAERKGFRLDKVGKGQQRFSIADLVGWKDGVRRSRPRILILTSRSRTVARFARRKGQGHVIADCPILLSPAHQERRSSRHLSSVFRPYLSGGCAPEAQFMAIFGAAASAATPISVPSSPSNMRALFVQFP